MNLFRRILVPHDFSPHASRALELAAKLARAHGGRLLVLHVITPFHPVGSFPEGDVAWHPATDVLNGERRRLEELVAETLGRKAPPVTCNVLIGDPFRRITDAARGADSIVMATAGRTGLAGILIGSVAEKVVRHAPIPVLTVRPAAVQKRARRPRSRRTKRPRVARR